MRVEEHFSAGGIVYRIANGDTEVILCGLDEPALWGLPKGTPDEGETVEETALREVREETGLEVRLEGELGEIEYWFGRPGARIHKRVRFFLMSPTGGSTDQHDPEFDKVCWFRAEEALEAMTHPSEANMVREAMRRVKTG